MRHLAAFLILWLTASMAPAQERPVSVFAAASLAGVLQMSTESYDLPTQYSFAGSGAIARQISNGAPADLVILASQPWMDWLAETGRIATEKITPVAGNRLVVISQAGASPLAGPREIADRLGTGRLAMGHRLAVPAGAYAMEWLRAEGLWAELSDRVAETDNVRMALSLVARRETPLGVVYATDARAEPAVSVVLDVPQDRHSPVLYPAAALTARGAALLDFLLDKPAQSVFADQGFLAVNE